MLLLCKHRLYAALLLRQCACITQLHALSLQLPMQAESSNSACISSSYAAPHRQCAVGLLIEDDPWACTAGGSPRYGCTNPEPRTSCNDAERTFGAGSDAPQRLENTATPHHHGAIANLTREAELWLHTHCLKACQELLTPVTIVCAGCYGSFQHAIHETVSVLLRIDASCHVL